MTAENFATFYPVGYVFHCYDCEIMNLNTAMRTCRQLKSKAVFMLRFIFASLLGEEQDKTFVMTTYILTRAYYIWLVHFTHQVAKDVIKVHQEIVILLNYFSNSSDRNMGKEWDMRKYTFLSTYLHFVINRIIIRGCLSSSQFSERSFAFILLVVAFALGMCCMLACSWLPCMPLRWVTWFFNFLVSSLPFLICLQKCMPDFLIVGCLDMLEYCIQLNSCLIERFQDGQCGILVRDSQYLLQLWRMEIPKLEWYHVFFLWEYAILIQWWFGFEIQWKLNAPHQIWN